MAVCPYCGAAIVAIKDLNIRRVTQATVINMVSCKSCDRVLGFSNDQ